MCVHACVVCVGVCLCLNSQLSLKVRANCQLLLLQKSVMGLEHKILFFVKDKYFLKIYLQKKLIHEKQKKLFSFLSFFF